MHGGHIKLSLSSRCSSRRRVSRENFLHVITKGIKRRSFVHGTIGDVLCRNSVADGGDIGLKKEIGVV